MKLFRARHNDKMIVNYVNRDPAKIPPFTKDYPFSSPMVDVADTHNYTGKNTVLSGKRKRFFGNRI